MVSMTPQVFEGRGRLSMNVLMQPKNLCLQRLFALPVTICASDRHVNKPLISFIGGLLNSVSRQTVLDGVIALSTPTMAQPMHFPPLVPFTAYTSTEPLKHTLW